MLFLKITLNVEEDHIFNSRMLSLDECTFGKNGAFNRNNHRHWSRGINHVVWGRKFPKTI
jgi:hypothetical protein